VVVYDRLVNPRLLREVGSGTELIYVGKTAGRHPTPQERINSLLVERAGEGKVVVRLKGGDPFVFGRGGEEAEALAEAGIPFEIVPGVTSAIAALAYAGIPATHRDYTSSFAVITGHEDPTKEDSTGRFASAIDWAKVSTGSGTLVFLMGVGNLPLIVDRLIEHGRSPQTPVALVRWGTEPRQETVTGTLNDIVGKVQAAGLRPPAVIVVGGVVSLREKLRWFDKLDRMPLLGRRVLVTRSREQASALSERLMELGADPIEFPVIQIAPPEDYSTLDEAIRRLSCYDWTIFTSVNGVKAFVGRLRAQGMDIRALGGVKLCAIGPATAAELSQYCLDVDFVPRRYVAEAIVEGIGDVEGQRILLPRADIARRALAVELAEAGAEVDDVVAYRTVLANPPGEDVRDMLLSGEIDTVTFTSSSTVRNFAAMMRDDDLTEILRGAMIACIGPITAKTATALGLRVDVVAEEYTIKGLISALVSEVTERGES
jgi:uroporphyrinogen III methyltransferase/synthase